MTRPSWRATMDDFLLWLALNGFEPEVPFKGTNGRRRWKWDHAHEGLKIAVEYQGMGVGHQSVEGTFRDHEKTTQGQLCGWLVVQCNARSVGSGHCHDWVEKAMELRG